MRLASSLLATAISCTGIGIVGAQEPIVVPDQAECARCRIVSRVVATLGGASDSAGLAGLPQSVFADRLGRYWVLPGAGVPMVFDSAGRFAQTVGTRGGGPGEFNWPFDAVSLPGDSVLILDRAGPRAVVVGPGLRPARSIRLTWPLGPAVALAWPGTMLANGNVGTPDGAGWPLHRVAMLGPDAHVAASFGSGKGLLRPGRYSELAMRLAPSRDGRVWAAYVQAYRLELWSGDGNRPTILERRPDWFSPEAGSEAGNPNTPPPSSIAAIQEGSDGLLWVFVRVAARGWRSAWHNVPEGAREVGARQIAVENLFATVIEVIDPARGRVVARTRLEQMVLSALPGGRVACYGVRPTGEPEVTVLLLRIARD